MKTTTLYLTLTNSIMFAVCSNAQPLMPISRLAQTSANYKEAVTILEAMFGIKPLTVAKHMDTLIHVDAVTSSNNVKGLRRLFDLVESNVGSLALLGVDSKSYDALRFSVLISKIPQDVQLIVRVVTIGIWKP